MKLLEAILELGTQVKTLKQSKRLERYVQSRGTGLITNSTGLLGDNTNFGKFTFDPTEAKVGMGCFVCDTPNAEVEIDELIPVSSLDSYKVEFFAKYAKGSNQGGAYFYVAPFDADGEVIKPMMFTDSTYKVERMIKGEKTITIHADDRQRFYDNLASKPTVATQFLTPTYTAQSGFVYPPNTYSRDNLSIVRSFNQMKYNKDTGVIADTYVRETVESGGIVPLAVNGANYAYIMPSMRYDTKLTEEWQYFSVSFKTSDLGAMFANASFIKIGWLLNRGVASGTTKISGVQMRQI